MPVTILERWAYSEGAQKVEEVAFTIASGSGGTVVIRDLVRVLEVDLRPINGASWNNTMTSLVSGRSDLASKTVTIVGTDLASYILRAVGY
jgi:hypothetical protein